MNERYAIEIIFFYGQTRIYKRRQSMTRGHTPSIWEVYKGCQNKKQNTSNKHMKHTLTNTHSTNQ